LNCGWERCTDRVHRGPAADECLEPPDGIA
jgi:hypothetical protein